MHEGEKATCQARSVRTTRTRSDAEIISIILAVARFVLVAGCLRDVWISGVSHEPRGRTPDATQYKHDNRADNKEQSEDMGIAGRKRAIGAIRMKCCCGCGIDVNKELRFIPGHFSKMVYKRLIERETRERQLYKNL